ncbi:MAG: hypothetical protein EOP45_00360 [Sphingobacteriaceae bacterium]|nr:MAG: hypothetical protein EOP45_00360 [Sphingobacteriaceae bacterium]
MQKGADHLHLFVLPVFLQPHARAYYVDLSNNETRDRFILDYKGKPGIYLWFNVITGEYYVGQAQDLGDPKSGRVFRYIRPGYLKTGPKGKSLIHNAFVKYGLSNFVLVILDDCNLDVLTVREQYWFDLLSPCYNILSAAQSSAGYTHTLESLSRMKGPRPYYKPTGEQNAALAERNRSREYTQEYRNMVSAREGHGVFVYSDDLKFLGYYPSINKAKQALNVKLHTVTIQKRMRQQVNRTNVLNMIWSHTPLPYKTMS